RRGWAFRRGEVAMAAAMPDTDATLTPIDPGPLVLEAAGAETLVTVKTEPLNPRLHHQLTRKRVAVGVLVLGLAAMGALYSQKDKLAPQVADTGREVVGDENWAKVESYFFRVEDRIAKTKYRFLGGPTNPFATTVDVEFVPRVEARTWTYYIGPALAAPGLTAEELAPTPLVLPKTTPLRDSLEAGEGVWTTAGLPRSTPKDVLMAKTFVRPDKSRPYALVGVLLIDSRRIRLNMTGGTVDPGGDRGVKGPGVIPSEAQTKLLLAWNGGFKGPHGSYGMIADGKEYRPMRAGLATICSYKDGTVKMGEWGTDLTATDTIAACRQNAVLLVKDGQVSKRTAEGNDTWGYVAVNSSEFITWRSAVGVTKDGSLLIAAGNSLSAATLASALWAAGAYTAMQLDINSPYVLLIQVYQQPDGTLRAERFMDNMPDSPARFLKTQERDFMWVTLDEARWR
ncbi:MAG: phosphodiester glycosidase family protein, partial [Anaerolineaceae bacterium]